MEPAAVAIRAAAKRPIERLELMLVVLDPGLEDVPVPHRRLDELDRLFVAPTAQRLVRHDRRDDRVAGAPWRDLDEKFGHWNSVFRRFRRWALKGIFEAVFRDLEQIAEIIARMPASFRLYSGDDSSTLALVNEHLREAAVPALAFEVEGAAHYLPAYAGNLDDRPHPVRLHVGDEDRQSGEIGGRGLMHR